MARKLRSLEEAPVDIFEAIKRAFIRGGLIPKKHRQKQTTPKPSEKIESADGPEKLVDLTVKAHDTLFKADTVFPFTLFPDTITLDREKLTIANRIFFRVAKIVSVPIADLLNVEADVGPFFGSIHVTSRYFAATTPRSVRFLSRANAVKLQRLLQGYIIAHERKIDCTEIDRDQLIILLNDLGQGASD